MQLKKNLKKTFGLEFTPWTSERGVIETGNGTRVCQVVLLITFVKASLRHPPLIFWVR